MKLRELTLVNIGPYEGKNTLALNTNENQNTILIGGQNGAGKTTLLHSVKLALYGPVAFGFKTASSTYLEHILTILNRNQIKNHRSNFQIKLSFSLNDGLNETDYSIVRSWVIKDSQNIVEKVEVLKQDSRLNDIEEHKFLESFRTQFPPELLDLCFFDGEDIGKLTEDDTLSHYLKELSYSLFDLDLFLELNNVLVDYQKQTLNTKVEKDLQAQVSYLQELIDNQTKQVTEIENKLIEKKERQKELNDINEKLKKEFKLFGGLLGEEREKLQKQIINLENGRKKVMDDIKDFIANQLPFYLTKDLLFELGEQLQKEENYYISKSLQHKINNLPIGEIIEELKIEANSNQHELLKNKLVTYLADVEEVNLIHNLSKTEVQKIYSIISQINEQNLSEIINKVQENKDNLSLLQKLKNQLKISEQESDFNELLNRLHSNNQQINIIENEIKSLEEKLKDLTTELNKHKNKLKSTTKELNKILRKKSSFSEVNKAINVSRKFINTQLKRKIKDAEMFSLSMINKVMRKSNFIRKIKINPDTFEIKVFDSENRLLDYNTFSAGEKQLLILSIIWGTIVASNKQVPFIFDTLLGRLDRKHRESIIKQLIPIFSKQVIILSTDTEVTKSLYTDLKEYISNEYTLFYDDSAKRTKIISGFFKFNKEVTVV